jgi:hypothetical protein
MIASIAITCAARNIVFTPDTAPSWLSYGEKSTMPLYLPSVDEPVELHGCDPIYVSIEPSEAARREGWAFQIPGESATHARRGGTSSFDFAVSAAAADVANGVKTITIQRYQERVERRRDLSRYAAGNPYRERAVFDDPLTVVSMQIKRKLTAYDMRASSGVRPGRNTRREASWSLAGRTRAQEGIVTSTSLTGVGESSCNHAVGSQLIECTQRMAVTSTPHPTTGTFRTNDDLHGARYKSVPGGAPRSPYGGVVAPDAGSTQTQAALRRQAVSVQHGVGTTPARDLLDAQPQYAYGSTVAVDAKKPLRRLTSNETSAVDTAFALFDVDDNGEISYDELSAHATSNAEESPHSATAGSEILTTVGVQVVGDPVQVRSILEDFDLVRARQHELIERQPGWTPAKEVKTSADSDGNSTNTTSVGEAMPEPEPDAGAPEPEPETDGADGADGGEQGAGADAAASRQRVSISRADFHSWVVKLLDQHIPGWTPEPPPVPLDFSESPFGYNGGEDKDQPLPTHYRKEERRLTYSQGATPFDDSEATRRAWWHPEGRTAVVGEKYDQPLPRSPFVDQRPEADNRHPSVAPPFDNEEHFVPSYATGKRTNAADPHS